jgi:hypothetical protein
MSRIQSHRPGQNDVGGLPGYETTTNSGSTSNTVLLGVFIRMMTWLRWSKQGLISHQRKRETQPKESEKKKKKG